MVSEARKQSMPWMETDYWKHTYFRWKVKWRLEHLGALGAMGETAPQTKSSLPEQDHSLLAGKLPSFHWVCCDQKLNLTSVVVGRVPCRWTSANFFPREGWLACRWSAWNTCYGLWRELVWQGLCLTGTQLSDLNVTNKSYYGYNVSKQVC